MSEDEKEALAESRQDAEFWARQDGIGGLEERLRKAAHAATPSDIRNPRDWFFMRGRDQLFWDAANPKDLIDILDAKDDALRTAIAERDEARAQRDSERRHAEDGETLRLEERRLRQAAEARLEEAKAALKRSRELIDAVFGENQTAHAWVKELRDDVDAFLHQGGSDAR